jgi:hypothetical protein
MGNLPTMSIVRLQAAIAQSENTKIIINTMLDILGNEKKLKEADEKLA